MAGHFLQNGWPTAPRAFGAEPQVSGFMSPSRFEGEINNLEVVGTIPPEINGTFYRVMPEPQFPAFIPNDPWFNGDGNISAFRVQGGHVDFKQKYVRTEKFVREAKARRALLGKYRNRYTDLVEFKVRSTANTNIVYWHGRLLALKEDSPPYAMDPTTLETIGLWDFEGQLPCLTFTAHPKFDPATREMACFGYEAKGDGTPDVCFYSFDKDGKMTECVWLVAPVVGMIHNFEVTENYVVFPMVNVICDPERLKAGGEHWQWENDVPTYIGVLPRRGATGADVKWFQAPHGFAGHSANAYEDSSTGKIIFDMAHSEKNAFFWWPDKNGVAPSPSEVSLSLRRWYIDPKTTNLSLPAGEVLVDENLEFARIDDRVATMKHHTIFFCLMDPTAGTDFPFVISRMGGGHPIFNGLGMYDSKTGTYEKFFAGPRKFSQECIFVPRSKTAEESDGWVMCLLNNYETMSSELVILDTKNFKEPVAIVKLPVRLRAGLHGNWVDAADADGHPDSL